MAEREPGLVHRNVEDLLENSHLRDLHRDDRADIVHESGKVGWLVRKHPCDQVDLLALSVAAEGRCSLERGADDRGIDRMFEKFRAATDVGHVVAAKRDRRARNSPLEVLAR